jgi:AAA domain, putative AbiEii toxin, Type IV TA system
MGNHIARANLNILNGTLQGTMEFMPGLNIISGENGTLKTQLLHSLRGGAAVPAQLDSPLRIQAISPKRNSERRATEAILEYVRQTNRTWETNLNERAGAQINVSGFDNYASTGELYHLIFNHRCKDGSDRRAHMDTVASEFNEIIQAVFPHYRVLATWDDRLGAPRVRLSKNAEVEIPIEALSMGEQEVLSLMLSLSTGRENIDVYLIDEPEVHLNWHLEERLFTFLDNLCESHGKQAIVVTHSRVIFKPMFLPKAQFLSWGEDKRVTWGRELSKQQRTRLAGDAIEIVALGDFSKTTFFVEDSSHAEIIEAIACLKSISINTSQCGNATNVISLYKYQLSNVTWSNAYFVIDGDNQGNPFPADQRFIHLPYYCIENILLDPETLAATSSRSLGDVRKIMLELIVANRNRVFLKNKFFEFLADSLSVDHMTFDRLKLFDASLIVKGVVSQLGLGSVKEVLPKYLAHAESIGRLSTLIPNQLMQAIQQADLGTELETSLPALTIR